MRDYLGTWTLIMLTNHDCNWMSEQHSVLGRASQPSDEVNQSGVSVQITLLVARCADEPQHQFQILVLLRNDEFHRRYTDCRYTIAAGVRGLMLLAGAGVLL